MLAGGGSRAPGRLDSPAGVLDFFCTWSSLWYCLHPLGPARGTVPTWPPPHIYSFPTGQGGQWQCKTCPRRLPHPVRVEDGAPTQAGLLPPSREALRRPLSALARLLGLGQGKGAGARIGCRTCHWSSFAGQGAEERASAPPLLRASAPRPEGGRHSCQQPLNPKTQHLL